MLADVPGWVVVEEFEEPAAITTLVPVDGADPEAVRAWLLAERRISPHLDTTAEDLDTFAEALVAATMAV